MELYETLLIVLQLTNILAKKYRGSSSSEESIENILYYKDCNHKRRNAEPVSLREPIVPPPPPPKPQECKMCCSMCCGDNCINNLCNNQGGSRQGPMMNERSVVGSMPKPLPRQPQGPIQPVRMRKKKFKQPLLPPIGSRRDFGFTRENIKSLISQDEDIKKILKDLVKVTMQKVDLVEMINARREQMDGTENPLDDSNNEEE